MNKQLKNALLVGMIILLFPACGRMENAPTDTPEPAVTVTDIPTNPPALGSTERTVPEKDSKYIGLHHPPLPDGLSEGFSMLIQESNEHNLSLVSDGAKRMLWLSKLSVPESSNKVSWEVQDILEFPNLEPGVILIPDGCSVNGKPDNEIFVIGRNETILFAWRANTTLNAFEAISTNGIVCHSDKAVTLN